MSNSFDDLAKNYDRWYDGVEGSAVFRDELACLRAVCPTCEGRWLEVGVGTGRFASEMGVAEGVDPSLNMLRLAARRATRTYAGVAEALPFPDNSFDGVLMALSLCFVRNAELALSECSRILRLSGTVALGVVPADGPWGESYRRKAAEGHPIYSQAVFRTVSETVALAKAEGFVLGKAGSALFWSPGDPPPNKSSVEIGVAEDAGFVALRFGKDDTQANFTSSTE